MAERTDVTNPWFALQRQLLDGSRTLLTQSVEMQRFTNQLVKHTLETQELLQRHGGAMARTAAHGYLDGTSVMTPTVPPDGMHELIDDQFDQAFEIHADTFDVLKRGVEQGADAYEDLSTEYVESVDEQFDSLLDTHHQFETQPIEPVEIADG
jgi:hypothetical protein